MRLIEGVNQHLPTFHRYLKLRRRVMALPDELHYYDLYAPLVSSVELRYTPEEAQAHVVSAMRPLGGDYTGRARARLPRPLGGLVSTEGKVSGAYSNGGAYDVHPYILLNYLGQYNDVSTLAHELGHTMHSYYSNKVQPYPTANYTTFVAEVASTFNEALLIDHVLKQIDDAPTRLSLLGNLLEGIKSTVFRQTQFAEFELRMHEMGEKGQPLTGDSLCELYLGDLPPATTATPRARASWTTTSSTSGASSRTSTASSTCSSTPRRSAPPRRCRRKCWGGDTATRDRYLTFLTRGGSKYPIDLLREAGVDMTTDEPLTLTMARMNAVMDEIREASLGAGGAVVGAAFRRPVR
jgi:oligoendopeptidase F